jgi:4-diphosphocytidyl-2-C-methyl-D-erythritol kinase
MNKIIIKSCAKINIGLNVIRKRNDGYHDIETIFYPINLFDKLIFEKSDKFQFTSNNEDLELNSSNLIFKAKNLLEESSGKIITTKILLQKKIPIGAGLGGGSSNCAVTLLSLNELFHLGVNEENLNKIALQLGSDVPFFINPNPSFATSRGEVLNEIKFKIHSPILIVNPGIHVSTKWAFENIRIEKRNFSLQNLIVSENFSFIDSKDKIVNDFEKVVFKKYPEIKNIKNEMYEAGALFSLMTGTGSTVFGIFTKLDEAVKAKKHFKKYFSAIHYEEV